LGAFDDQCDGLVSEALVGDGVAAAHLSEHRGPLDRGGLEPRSERADRASRTAQLFPARALRHGDPRSCLPSCWSLRIRSARVADPSKAVRGVESVAYERMF
jgi:hypothetical protein